MGDKKLDRMSLDELMNSASELDDPSIISADKTDGEIPFELDDVSREDIERFKFLIEQPTEEVSLDFINNKNLRDWAETFNGKVPSEWIKSSRSLMGFFDKMNSLPQSLYRYIPADWITAAILWNPPNVLLQELATKYPLRLVDVISLENQEDVEFDWTKEVYKIYQKYESLIKQGINYIPSDLNLNINYLPNINKFCKIYLTDFMKSRFHFQPNRRFLTNGHNLDNFRKTQTVKQIYNLIDNPSLNEDFMLLSQEYNTGPLKLDLENIYNKFFNDTEAPTVETIYWAEYHNLPVEKTLNYVQLTELLTRTSLHNQKFDSEIIDALVTCPTHWSTLLNLSAFTKLSISQNTTLFTRILCNPHPNRIQEAIMHQLLLGTSLENIDISIGLALKNRISLSEQARQEGRVLNTTDFIELLQEIKAIENQKGFMESIGESIKEFLKLGKAKKIRGEEEA
jgi:hypothetical protein